MCARSAAQPDIGRKEAIGSSASAATARLLDMRMCFRDLRQMQHRKPKAVCTCATKQDVRNWTRQDVVYDTAHQLTGYFKPPWSSVTARSSLSGPIASGRSGTGSGEGEKGRGKPTSGRGPLGAYSWDYSAFQYSSCDGPPQRIAARAASQRMPRPFGPRH